MENGEPCTGCRKWNPDVSRIELSESYMADKLGVEQVRSARLPMAESRSSSVSAVSATDASERTTNPQFTAQPQTLLTYEFVPFSGDRLSDGLSGPHYLGSTRINSGPLAGQTLSELGIVASLTVSQPGLDGEDKEDSADERPVPDELDDYEKPDEVPALPNTRVGNPKLEVDYDSEHPPVMALGDRDEAGFRNEWGKAKKLPAEMDWELACPSAKLKYKVGIFWRESEEVGTANTQEGAADMGEGAADAVDIAQEIQDNIKDGVLESQVRAYLMQAKRWECADPKCELTVEITDREYGLIVQTSWEPINVGQDVKFKVSLFRTHVLRAVFKVYCKSL